jgi:hypothetical protein
MWSMTSLLLAFLALMRVVPASDGCAAVSAFGLAAGMGGDDTHSQNNMVLISTPLRSYSMRGHAGARHD